MKLFFPDRWPQSLAHVYIGAFILDIKAYKFDRFFLSPSSLSWGLWVNLMKNTICKSDLICYSQLQRDICLCFSRDIGICSSWYPAEFSQGSIHWTNLSVNPDLSQSIMSDLVKKHEHKVSERERVLLAPSKRESMCHHHFSYLCSSESCILIVWVRQMG